MLAQYQSLQSPADFVVDFPSLHVNYTSVTGTINGGPAVSMAVLVNPTDLGNATWVVFSSTFTVNLGTGDGVRDVWVGLRGFSGAGVWRRTRLVLDTVAPAVVITEPAQSTTSRPILQVQGYTVEPLRSVTYDLANTATNIVGESGFVRSQWYDTNVCAVTTNWFQLYDLELATGANTVTLRAVDLAGNSSTTTLVCTLDFTGDTTAPLITLHWPQDTAEIAADTFDLRGQLDDPTATVSVSGLSEEPIQGVVERNGLFWVEGLPLAAGQNSLTLTATDAAGNTASIPLTLTRSATTITISEVPEESLGGQAVDVSGTINDNTYVVWVNGVRASLGGQDETGAWTWSASAVPLNDGGTAIFQARAIPLTSNNGNGTGTEPFNGQTLGNPTDPGQRTDEGQEDKPPRCYVDIYSEYYQRALGDSDPIPRDYAKVETVSMGWGYKLGGRRHSIQDYEDWHLFSPDPVPGPNHVEVIYTWLEDYHWPPDDDGTWVCFDDFGGYDTGGAYPPDIPLEVCKVADIRHPPASDFDTDTYARAARANYKLKTGGKAVSKRSNLFSFYCIAERILSTRWRPPESILNMPNKEGILPAKIQLLGQIVGNDGYLYRVLPDNAEFDMTPEVEVEFYTFGVAPQKHKLKMLANDVELEQAHVVPGARFCAGQKLVFSAVFDPPVPNVVYQWHSWGLDSKYINTWTVNTAGCRLYETKASLTRLNPINAWYISGGQKRATYATTLRFLNGQSVRGVSALGLYMVHRPRVLGLEEVCPGNPCKYTINGELVLGLGTLGTDGTTFKVRIETPYRSGKIYTQLIQRDTRWNTWSNERYDNTSGQYWLDNDESYEWALHLGHPLQPSSTLRYYDGPFHVAGYTHVFMHDDFKVYFRFKPYSNGGSEAENADNIYVTLGRIDWNWCAYMEDEGGGEWVITSSTVSEIEPHWDDDSFPIWDHVYHNN